MVRANNELAQLFTNTQPRPLKGFACGVFGFRGSERGMSSDLKSLLDLASFKGNIISFSSVQSAKAFLDLKISRVGRSSGECVCALRTSKNCTILM